MSHKNTLKTPSREGGEAENESAVPKLRPLEARLLTNSSSYSLRSSYSLPPLTVEGDDQQSSLGALSDESKAAEHSPLIKLVLDNSLEEARIYMWHNPKSRRELNRKIGMLMHNAMRQGNRIAVEWLYNEASVGQAIFEIERSYGAPKEQGNVLMLALYYRVLEIVQWILSDINVRDDHLLSFKSSSKTNPISFAASLGFLSGLEVSLDALNKQQAGLGRSYLQAVNAHGDTALSMAVRFGHTEVVTYLLKKYKLNVDAMVVREEGRESLIEIAAKEKHFDIYKLLYRQGAKRTETLNTEALLIDAADEPEKLKWMLNNHRYRDQRIVELVEYLVLHKMEKSLDVILAIPALLKYFSPKLVFTAIKKVQASPTKKPLGTLKKLLETFEWNVDKITYNGNAEAYHGFTLLMFAVIYNLEECVFYLLFNHGVNIEPRISESKSYYQGRRASRVGGLSQTIRDTFAILEEKEGYRSYLEKKLTKGIGNHAFLQRAFPGAARTTTVSQLYNHLNTETKEDTPEGQARASKKTFPNYSSYLADKISKGEAKKDEALHYLLTVVKMLELAGKVFSPFLLFNDDAIFNTFVKATFSAEKLKIASVLAILQALKNAQDLGLVGPHDVTTLLAPEPSGLMSFTSGAYANAYIKPSAETPAQCMVLLRLLSLKLDEAFIKYYAPVAEQLSHFINTSKGLESAEKHTYLEAMNNPNTPLGKFFQMVNPGLVRGVSFALGHVEQKDVQRLNRQADTGISMSDLYGLIEKYAADDLIYLNPMLQKGKPYTQKHFLELFKPSTVLFLFEIKPKGVENSFATEVLTKSKSPEDALRYFFICVNVLTKAMSAGVSFAARGAKVLTGPGSQIPKQFATQVKAAIEAKEISNDTVKDIINFINEYAKDAPAFIDELLPLRRKLFNLIESNSTIERAAPGINKLSALDMIIASGEAGAPKTGLGILYARAVRLGYLSRGEPNYVEMAKAAKKRLTRQLTDNVQAQQQSRTECVLVN